MMTETVHRFVNIGSEHAINVNHITHIWTLEKFPDIEYDERQIIRLHSVQCDFLIVHEDDGTFEFEEAKKLRDQLVGGWHDLNFVEVGPRLCVNPKHISDIRLSGDNRLCIYILGNHVIGMSPKDVGYEGALKLRHSLLFGDGK